MVSRYDQKPADWVQKRIVLGRNYLRFPRGEGLQAFRPQIRFRWNSKRCPVHSFFQTSNVSPHHGVQTLCSLSSTPAYKGCGLHMRKTRKNNKAKANANSNARSPMKDKFRKRLT